MGRVGIADARVPLDYQGDAKGGGTFKGGCFDGIFGWDVGGVMVIGVTVIVVV